jgi:NDP-sugar pyrophosphorylase family protein
MTKTSIQKAVVLAAGRGTRMGEITSDTPKAMLPVRGKPLLEHVLDGLAQAGVERFLIVVGYRRDVIENHFRNWRLPVEFRVQDPINGTGAATRLGREFVGYDAFLLALGDILCDLSAYARCGIVLDEHPNTAGVLGVKAVEDPWRAAAVYAENGVITRVVEKPPQGSSTTHWSSAGLWAFRSLVFDYLDRIELSPRGEYELTSIFDAMLADGLELRISSIEGEWTDVGRPEDLAAVNTNSKDGE